MRSSMIVALFSAVSAAASASSWDFSHGTVTISAKNGSNTIFKLQSDEVVQEKLVLGHQDKLKVALTTKEGNKPKKPHQAFLIIKESSGLEAPFPLTLKESGKGSVEITQKDLPVQLLASPSPLNVSLVLGSFGSYAGSETPLFDVSVQLDANARAPTDEIPLRYGPQPEIHHVFREDPTSPPKIVSIAFAVAVVAMVPCLFLGWNLLGGNVNHAGMAFVRAPVAHIVFFGSIVAMEGVFAMYYRQWKLFQTLPAIGLVGIATFLSGNRALREVQHRRLAGERE